MSKDIVICEPTGGLGNQLFCIANAYAYSLRYNKKFYVTRFWKGITKDRPTYWEYILSYFKDNNHLVYPQQYKKVKSYTEPSLNYSQIPFFDYNVILKGYFQSEKYFEDYKRQVCKVLSLPDNLRKFAESKVDKYDGKIIVAVHIRRGDYLKSDGYHNILNEQYYSLAKKTMEEKLGCRPIYLYFTNEPSWVKETFKYELEIHTNDCVIEGYKDYEEFAIMQQCHHFIIANSSFSWWAAYLNNILEGIALKIVIAPENWYGPKGPKDWSDIYPKEWIRIKDIDGLSVEEKNNIFMGIITCNKYDNIRKKQDLSKTPFKYKYFIGDPDFQKPIEVDDIVYLPCPDNYESLPIKVYNMIKYIRETYPEVKYIIKADDDVKFDFDKFEKTLASIYFKNLDYSGIVVKNEEYEGTCHLGKCEDPEINVTKVKVPAGMYCAGPCYILSQKSADILLEKLLINNTIYEDQSVGNCLVDNNIVITNTNLKECGCEWK